LNIIKIFNLQIQHNKTRNIKSDFLERNNEKMMNFGKSKNIVGLKPNAEWKKDAKAPSSYIGTELVAD